MTFNKEIKWWLVEGDGYPAKKKKKILNIINIIDHEIDLIIYIYT